MVTIPENAKRVFAGQIFDVYQWPQKLFDDSEATFEMLKRPDTVFVIAIKDGKLVLTRQKQPNTGWFYSFAGGRVDAEDADELAAAKRELLEETGMSFKNWRLIRAVQPHKKVDWVIYTFLATCFESQTEAAPDAGEQIELELLDFADLVSLDGSIDCSRLKTLEEFESLDDLLAQPELYSY